MREATLDAALDLLREEGFAGMTVEGVAERAGVHRTTVHRRWQSRAALVADALLDVSAEQVPVPDSGSISTDLRLFARAVRDAVSSPLGRGIASALVDPGAAEELSDVNRRFWDARFTATRELVERAIARGEVPAHTDPRFVIEAVGGPIWFRTFVLAERADDDFLDRLVAAVVAGVREARS